MPKQTLTFDEAKINSCKEWHQDSSLTTFSSRSSLQLPTLAQVIHHQQRQNVPGLQEISPKESAWLVHQPENPLPPQWARPAWRCRHRTSNVIDGRTIRRQNHIRLEPREIVMSPKLLSRHPHSHHQQIRPV